MTLFSGIRFYSYVHGALLLPTTCCTDPVLCCDVLCCAVLCCADIVGDPRQLPAYVASRAAEKAGLGKSLFERLEQAGHAVVMLSVQYR